MQVPIAKASDRVTSLPSTPMFLDCSSGLPSHLRRKPSCPPPSSRSPAPPPTSTVPLVSPSVSSSLSFLQLPGTTSRLPSLRCFSSYQTSQFRNQQSALSH
ncbi:hypothetical protein CGRA01v4_02742 [Colletotrichum graminicola]|nr:hypothetical protein CGRA01v4_02742 [Colletotrichum graminicola]